MKIFTRTLILSVFFIGIILLSISFLFEGSQSNIISFDEVENGDLVFRRGRSIESFAVFASDRKSKFSHVGIICIKNKITYVIHAIPSENKKVPDYVRKDKLSDFLSPKKASEFSIYRSDFSDEINNRAANNAFLFFENKLTFDGNYDLDSDDQLYCTELVLKAFQFNTLKTLKIKSTNLNFIFWEFKCNNAWKYNREPSF